MRQFARIWSVFLALGGVAYPVCVYFFQNEVPLWSFSAIALCLLFFRWQRLGRKIGKNGAVISLCGVLGFVLFVAVLRPHLAAHVYPVAVSLLFAFFFGFSLLFPPTVVERIARIKTPGLSDSGVKYTRCVTWVWFLFLVANAAIAYGLALSGEFKLWMLWTSLYSYICMAVLFVGEFAVRKLKRLEAS